MKITKKKLLLALMTVFITALCAFLIPVKEALAGTQSFIVPNETKPIPVNFINGSFEQPEVTRKTGPDEDVYLEYFPMASVPGWETIPVDPANWGAERAYYIELQKVDPDGTWGLATTEADGDQYAELNTDFPCRLYQNASTTPGSRVVWQFAHRARRNAANASGTGLDVLNFYLRPAGSPSVMPNAAQLICTASDNALNWYYYRGVYLIPSGQTNTEFVFQSVSSASGSADDGNLLDAIRFQTGAKIIAKKSISTSASDNSTALKGETVTITVAITNWGETDASRCVFYDVLSDDLAYVTGSALINGVNAGNLVDFDSSSDTLRVNFGAGAVAGLMSIDGGVLKGSQSTGTAGTTGQGETITISFQAVVTGDIGEIVKNQASVVYCDKDYENYNGLIMCSYSSVSGRTVSSSDETSYVNRFTIVGGAINGRVWFDTDGDGTIDSGESRDSGETVGLYLNSDATFSSPVKTATTNSSGVYSFSGVSYGNYKVAVATPSGYAVTKLANDNDAVASGTRAAINGLSVSTVNTISNKDIGFTQNRTISGRIWNDLDADGMIDTGETRISGLSVGIYVNTTTSYLVPVNSVLGTPLTTTTNASGEYSFSYIPEGTYKVVVTTPGGYVVTVLANDNDAYSDGSYAVVRDIALISQNQVSNVDFGFTPNRTISGRAWYDLNRNGTLDGLMGTEAETMVSGLTISAYASTDTNFISPALNLDGNPMTYTTTFRGTYSFSKMPPGIYNIVATTPSGYAVTVLANDNDAVAVGTKAVIYTVNLTIGTSISNKDFGFTPSRTISGIAWYDADADGMIDSGEAKAQGISLAVFLNTTTDYNTAPVADANGNTLVTATNSNGEYFFSDIPAGIYKVVQMYREPNCDLTVKTDTTDNKAVNSGGWFQVQEINLTTATSTADRDFGYLENRSITGRVWQDVNEDGTIDASEVRISGLTVGVYQNSDTTYTTPVNDIYGNALTTVTNTSGVYSFSYIPQGTYKIVVTTPSGYDVTVLANDNDASASGDYAVISNISLSSVIALTNKDFGFKAVRTISGRIWEDMDGDGALETGENRFSSILVGVYQNGDTTCTAPVLDVQGNPLTTTTDSSGNYSFSGIPSGTYKVVAEMPDGYMVTKLANDNDAVAFGLRAVVSNIDLSTSNTIETIDFGYIENRTISGRVWVDSDVDGTIDATEGLLTGTVFVRLYNAADLSLANDVFGYALVRIVSATGTYKFTGVPAGEYYAAIITPNGYAVTVHANDNDAVAAVYGRSAVGVLDVTTERNLVDKDFGFFANRSLSGRVWFDMNADGMIDSGETRLPDLGVALYDADDMSFASPINDVFGNPLTTLTNSNGEYTFTGIPVGSYRCVITTPDGMTVTTRTVTTDNDASTYNESAITDGFSFSETPITYDDADFGFTLALSIAKSASVNGGVIDNGTVDSPVHVAVGDTIEYTVSIDWDDASGIDAIGQVDISDTIPVGLELVTDTGSYTSGMTWNIDAVTGQTTVSWNDATVTSENRAFYFRVRVASPQDENTEMLYVNAANVQSGSDVSVTNSTYHTLNACTITISKVVKGDLSDPNQMFTFRITLENAPVTLTYRGQSTISGVSVPADGVISSGYAEVQLMHGQSIVIQDVPLGTSYTISETLLSNGYSVSITEVNGESITLFGSAGVQGTLTGDVNVLFTNTLNMTIPTGIVLDVLPYALFVLLGGGVIALILITQRAKRMRRKHNRGKTEKQQRG
jgi:uncharacterized repeat protein (TIGR01451 family)